MHFRTAMCGGEPCSGSSGTARNFFWRAGSLWGRGLVPGLPLMHPAFYIPPARVEEAAALSDLCFRSKAVWGYDHEFMH